jgi:hypothetical protein
MNEGHILGVSLTDMAFDLFGGTMQNITETHPARPLLSQLTLVMTQGLALHADEIVTRGSLEEYRSIYSLHAGYTAVQGASWSQVGTYGIAIPGVMDGKVGLSSPGLQIFMAQMAYLLGHVLVERMLSSTTRSNQGIPCNHRSELQKLFLDWLGIKQSTTQLRAIEAITISISSQGASPHYDSQNDSRDAFDHICWAVHYPERMSDLLCQDSCCLLLSHGIDPDKQVAFTVIAYTRAVIGNHTALAIEVAEVGCLLLRCYTQELNNNSPERHDVGHLEDAVRRKAFLQKLESLRTVNTTEVD